MNLKKTLYMKLTVCLLGVIITYSALSKENKAANLVGNAIVKYQNFPKVDVDFYDVSGILNNPKVFKEVIDNLSNHYKHQNIEAILAIDARGFLFATPLAYKLNIPVVMLRKPGKLPGKTIGSEYTKEYGKDTLEIQVDALRPGQRVVIIDDLIATGGTFKAAINLAQKAGAEVVEVAAIIELIDFKEKRNLDVTVYSVVKK